MSDSASALALENDHQQFVESIKQGLNNIMVAVRIRPLNQKELAKSDFETVKVLDERVIVLLDPGFELNPDDVLRKNRNKEMQFAFDFVFDKSTAQLQVYQNTAQLLIPGVFEGFNATIFAYGATGAGKTYTMIGQGENAGIMERSMNDLFLKMQEDSLIKEIFVRASYIEIYNETIKDILSGTDKNLDLREDPTQGVTINGLTEIEVKTTAEIIQLLKIGNKNRTVECTGANEVSSRSHAVLQLTLQIKEKAGGINQEIQYSKLSLVDLAGSERASNTQNKGIRLIEGAKINQSLLILGNCIQALSEASEKNIKNPFIQYRGSKLTRLLKDSLGGNCRTVMIANVSGHTGSFEDTYNTLNFANRAKSIKTSVQRNYLAVENHISNYAILIDSLKKENQNLKRLLTNKSPTADLKENINLQSNSENCSAIEGKINEHFKKEIESIRRADEFIKKIDEIQINNVKVEEQHIQGINDSLNNQERVINLDKLLKLKSDEEKKSSELILVRGKLKKMISQQQEVLNPSEQQYLISAISQNEVQLEQIENELKEKREVDKSKVQKDRQIKLLKDQLKLRDEIISEQRNILSKNQLSYQVMNNSSLIELEQIDLASQIFLDSNGGVSKQQQKRPAKHISNYQSPENAKFSKLNIPAKKVLRPIQKFRMITKDFSDQETSQIEKNSSIQDKNFTKKISKLVLDTDKSIFTSEGDNKIQLPSLSRASPYSLKQSALHNIPYTIQNQQQQQSQQGSYQKLIAGESINNQQDLKKYNKINNQQKRNYFQGIQMQRKMAYYHEGQKKYQSTSVHQDSFQKSPSSSSRINYSGLDKSFEDYPQKDKLIQNKLSTEYTDDIDDHFSLMSKQNKTPKRLFQQHPLSSRQELEQILSKNKFTQKDASGNSQSPNKSHNPPMKIQQELKIKINDNFLKNEQLFQSPSMTSSQDSNYFNKNKNIEDSLEELYHLKSSCSPSPKTNQLVNFIHSKYTREEAKLEEINEKEYLKKGGEQISISVDEAHGSNKKVIRLKQLNQDIKQLKSSDSKNQNRVQNQLNQKFYVDRQSIKSKESSSIKSRYDSKQKKI